MSHFSPLIWMLRLRVLLSQASSTGHEEGQAFLEGESVAHQRAKLPNCSTASQGSSITEASTMNHF